MSSLAKQRHRRHANPFTVRGPIEDLDWRGIYGRTAPIALDIGCGAGRYLVQLAATNPQWNVLGLEIRQHLVDSALQAARAAQLGNVYALLANANVHLHLLVPRRTVAFVSVNFPDPWYKKRHHKRRVVDAPWLTELTPLLAEGAEFHAMTDYLPIAQQMRETLRNQAGFVSLDGEGEYAPQPTTPYTSEREIKHLSRGEEIYRMRFIYGLAKTSRIL